MAKLLAACEGALGAAELMAAVGIKDRKTFAKNYLNPAIAAGLLTMTQPNAPRSSTQKYRLTELGETMRSASGVLAAAPQITDPADGDLVTQSTDQHDNK